MFNKILYIVKSRLHYYPPCVSQIKILRDLGCDVTVLYGSCEEGVLRDLASRGIACEALSDRRGVAPGILDKACNWLSFRRSLSARLKGVDRASTLLWFGNAETLLPMKGRLSGFAYVITYLELLDTMKLRLLLLRRMSRRARAVVTCEETRSYLMKYWFGLAQTPYTLPNKPYAVEARRRCAPTTEAGRAVLRAVDGRRFVIYQGIFQDYEYLAVVASVLRDKFPDFCLVMMGIDRKGIADSIRQINPNTVFTDYIPAPKHLEVTANADIGLLFYNPDSLNKAFCAPNKIFEYSYFGLPILGNDIPGLQNTVGRANAGACVEFTEASVSAALHRLVDDYDRYSDNARRFYESVDNVGTISDIIRRLGCAAKGEDAR